MANSYAVCYTITFSIILLVGLILFGISFSVIELNNVGLLKNKFSISLESDKIYRSGRYFIGLQGVFIGYPTIWQYITFSSKAGSQSYFITGKTQAGSQIILEISLSYRIKIEFLFDLFKKYPNQNQQTDMITSAKSAIQNVISQYNNDDFFNQRDSISLQMSTEVNKEFKNKFFCELTLFLLREIKLESQFEQKIIDQQVKKRQAITATENQTVQVIQGQISVINSNASLLINNLISIANRNSSQILAKANSEGDAAIMVAEADAYKQFIDPSKLNFTETELLKYFYMKNIIKLGGNYYSGFPDSAVFAI